MHRRAALVFVLSVGWALVSPLCTRDAAFGEEDARAVVAALQPLPQRTFVLIHPPWRDDVLRAVRDAGFRGDIGLALPPDAMEGRRPVVLVEVPHAPSPAGVTRLVAEKRAGAGSAALTWFNGAAQADTAADPGRGVAPPGAQAIPSVVRGPWNLMEALKTAEVNVVFGQQRTIACNRWDASGQRWLCPGMNEWNYVGPREVVVNGEGRMCVWAHPVTGASLNIRFPGVPPGRFTLSTALHDGATMAEDGAAVRVELTGGPGERAAITHPNEPGLRETVLTRAGASDVTLDITTPSDGARHFCFLATVTP